MLSMEARNDDPRLESSDEIPSARSQLRRRRQAAIAASRYARLGDLMIRLSKRIQIGDRDLVNYHRIRRLRDLQRRISETWADYWRRNARG